MSTAALRSTQRTGVADAVTPLVRRVLAPNPSAFTFTGTQTYLLGRGEVAVIDPGPADPAHVEALLAATAGERITAILCTHTHRDHSPAAALLRAHTGAPVIGCAPLLPAGEGGFDAAFDRDYRPDRILADGDRLDGKDWSLEAIATPGHTSNHLCFACPEADLLFSGDHLMGWSTSVVIPPDGRMGDYMASLERLIGRQEATFLPGHGDPVLRPQAALRSALGHRRFRDGQIQRVLAGADGALALSALVTAMYAGLDPRLVPAATQTVLAHLIDLEERGLVARDGMEWRAR